MGDANRKATALLAALARLEEVAATQYPEDIVWRVTGYGTLEWQEKDVAGHEGFHKSPAAALLAFARVEAQPDAK